MKHYLLLILLISSFSVCVQADGGDTIKYEDIVMNDDGTLSRDGLRYSEPDALCKNGSRKVIANCKPSPYLRKVEECGVDKFIEKPDPLCGPKTFRKAVSPLCKPIYNLKHHPSCPNTISLRVRGENGCHLGKMFLIVQVLYPIS